MMFPQQAQVIIGGVKNQFAAQPAHQEKERCQSRASGSTSRSPAAVLIWMRQTFSG